MRRAIFPRACHSESHHRRASLMASRFAGDAHRVRDVFFRGAITANEK
jgi:hypothetical protein